MSWPELGAEPSNRKLSAMPSTRKAMKAHKAMKAVEPMKGVKAMKANKAMKAANAMKAVKANKGAKVPSQADPLGKIWYGVHGGIWQLIGFRTPPR